MVLTTQSEEVASDSKWCVVTTRWPLIVRHLRSVSSHTLAHSNHQMNSFFWACGTIGIAMKAQGRERAPNPCPSRLWELSQSEEKILGVGVTGAVEPNVMVDNHIHCYVVSCNLLWQCIHKYGIWTRCKSFDRRWCWTDSQLQFTTHCSGPVRTERVDRS